MISPIGPLRNSQPQERQVSRFLAARLLSHLGFLQVMLVSLHEILWCPMLWWSDTVAFCLVLDHLPMHYGASHAVCSKKCLIRTSHCMFLGLLLKAPMRLLPLGMACEAVLYQDLAESFAAALSPSIHMHIYINFQLCRNRPGIHGAIIIILTFDGVLQIRHGCEPTKSRHGEGLHQSLAQMAWQCAATMPQTLAAQ